VTAGTVHSKELGISRTGKVSSNARRIRRELLAGGYDGLVVYDGGGDGVDYVIALVEGIVRVVTER
jgi:hypothetical protein